MAPRVTRIAIEPRRPLIPDSHVPKNLNKNTSRRFSGHSEEHRSPKPNLLYNLIGAKVISETDNDWQIELPDKRKIILRKETSHVSQVTGTVSVPGWLVDRSKLHKYLAKVKA